MQKREHVLNADTNGKSYLILPFYKKGLKLRGNSS